MGQEKSLSNLKLATLPLSFMHKYSEFSPSLPGYFKNCYNYLPAFFSHLHLFCFFISSKCVNVNRKKKSGEEKKKRQMCPMLLDP